MRTVRSPELDTIRAHFPEPNRDFSLALIGPVYCAGFVGNANPLGEISNVAHPAFTNKRSLISVKFLQTMHAQILLIIKCRQT